MTNAEMLRPYVQQKVQEFLGVEQLQVDADGDIPIRQGSSVSFARLLDGPTGPVFRVFSPLLSGITKSTELLERLNDLNAGAPYVRFFWAADHVFCAIDLKADTLEPEEITNAIGAVAWHADNIDDLLKKDFGGTRMVEDETPPKPASDTTYL